MTVEACVLLHPFALRPRWVHDVHATWCEMCGHLFVPEPPAPSDAPRMSDPSGRRSPQPAARRWRPEAVLGRRSSG